MRPRTPFLVMELLNGPSVKDEIAQRGWLEVDDVRRIVPPLCNALELAHRSGIVHRDLKPANIVRHDFAGGDQVYKIVDFGIANLREATDETRLTGADQFIGTIAYASPEQLAAGTIDQRSDVYSLGVVVFEMLTGRVPFDGHDAIAIVTAHLSSPVPRPSQFRPQLPAWVDLVVGRALEKRPADRWQSMADFGAAIAAGDGRPTVASDGTPSALLATYDIQERIGPGRLGSEVFRGVHRALGHPVAIRMLRPNGQRNWDGVRAPVSPRGPDAAAGAPLDHPGARLRRRGRPRLRRHRIHPGAEPARADGGDGSRSRGRGFSRCSSSSSTRRGRCTGATACCAA